VPFHSRGRDAERVGRLFDGKPSEVSQLDDVLLDRRKGGKLPQRVVERQKVEPRIRLCAGGFVQSRGGCSVVIRRSFLTKVTFSSSRRYR
jgi:hypothetical protein